MGAAKILISSQTVGSGGASTVVFSSIPQTYTDLLLLASGRSTYSSVGVPSLYISTNITGTYTELVALGNGSSATSSSGTGTNQSSGRIRINKSTDTASVFSNTGVYFTNYTSTINKTYSSDSVRENNATDGYQEITAGIIPSTSAITSITLSTDGSFVQYSSFYLYGITKS
jgi:hypothetical protein